jgi:hypothetical protein
MAGNPSCWRLVLMGVGLALAAGPAAAEPAVDFARDVRPILAHHCGACHGPDEHARQANLRLDDRAAAVAARAIVPGDPKASKLVARIEAANPRKQMPPPEAKKPLSEREKQILRAWVEQGAAYAPHWAFVPPQRPAAGPVRNAAWARNPMDAFVLHRLERAGMAPAPEADPATLLRRVTLDLTGLPPSVADLDAFLADTSPGAYERAVDRLLASPAHAERMALAWLDVARYADTNGYNNDEDRTQWPWRDWLIDAFRRNLPYDQFIVEQLAGDLLPNPTLAQRVATGFLRNQVHNTEGGIIPEEYRVEYVADRIHTTATAFLGLSLQCARCHDHKFDPVTQREYYQFFAFFNNLSDKQASYNKFVGAEPFLRVPTADQQAQAERLGQARAALEKQLREHEAGIAQAVTAWEKGLTPEARRNLAGTGATLRIPLDETAGPAVATSDPAVRGTVQGSPRWAAGKVGGALEFDGKTHVLLPPGPGPNPDGPFSVALWVLTQGKGSVALLSRMDEGAAYRGFDLLLEDGKVTSHLIHRWPEEGLKVATKQPIPRDGWHHLALTYDGTKMAAGVKVYVDGQPQSLDVAKDTLHGTARTEQPLRLGLRQTSLPFVGKLDDVQFFGLALAPADAADLAAGKPVRLVADLLDVPAEQRTADQQARIRQFYLTALDREYGRLKAELAATVKQLGDLEQAAPAVMILQELPQPRETHLLRRGQYDQPGDKVLPGVPAVLPPLPPGKADRLALARWLVDPAHPLTARVAVNRWWQAYFGTGLVKTVEDFGTTGELPSHPELLDYLATELIRSGWDVRAMQRLIVLSATYRQSSRVTAAQYERDPENRLLGRGPRYRLPAETVRDNALAVSGLLVPTLGGPSVKPYQPPGLWEDVTVERRGKYVADTGPGLYRRSLYVFWKRTCPPPGLSTFDAPNREVCVARRAVTNTPLQALVLMNDPTYVEAARKLAERAITEGGATAEGRLAYACRCALARPPAPDEVRILLGIRQAALDRFRADPEAARQLLAVGQAPIRPGLDAAEVAAWTAVAGTILNLDEAISKR